MSCICEVILLYTEEVIGHALCITINCAHTTPEIRYYCSVSFSLQLLIEVHMENLLDDLKEHFASKLLRSVASLQSIEQALNTDHVSAATDKPQWTIDCAGEAILNCLKDLSKPKVCNYIHMHVCK